MKGFLGVVVTGVVTAFGFYMNSQQNAINLKNSQIEEENRQARTLVELVNSRETAMVQLRSQMFNSLLDKYLTGEDLESKIAVLEMIGLNFRDAIQIKPLFVHLDQTLIRSRNAAEFETASGPGDAAPRVKLRSAAGRVIKDQLDQVRMTEDGAVCEMTLTEGADAEPVPCLFNLKLQLSKVEDAAVKIRPESNSANFRVDDRLSRDGFAVTYFDMPMVDFTSMDFGVGKIRYAVVLLKATEKSSTTAGSATLAVAVLPATALTKQNAYLFDELVAKKIGMIDQQR